MLLTYPKKILSLGKDTGLFLIDNFLSPRECSILIKLCKKKGKKGVTFGGKNDKTLRCQLYYDSSPTVLSINNRIFELTRFPLVQGEILSVVGYPEGGSYFPHTDYISDEPKNTNGGRRIAQMLMYLNDVEEGGETFFPELGIKVSPQKGRALLWYSIKDMTLPKSHNLNIPTIFRNNPYAYHQPLPIIKGEKWIAAKFFHNIIFNH